MSAIFGRMDTMRRDSPVFGGWDRFDYVMVFAALGLVAYGLALIYSGSQNLYDGPVLSLANPTTKQAIFAGLGVFAMFVVSRIDYHYFAHYWWVLYALAILSLVALLFIGDTELGSTRWFAIGPLQVQPSEFAKLAVIVTMARFFHEWGGDAKQLRALLWSIAIVAPVTALVFIQPDLGTTIMFGAIWLGMVLVAGVSRSHLIMLAGLCIAVVPFAWAFAVEDYQVERISVLIDPYEDQGGLGAGFNNIQSEIAVGSGGLTGKGLTNGEQTQLDYLKVPTRDFIFSVAAEELGFIGAMGLFSLFIILLMRGIRVASVAGDSLGQLIAVGIVVLILSQAFINLAVNLQLFPVTGLPLPFVSQGGSSLVSLFVSLGILQSILVRHRSYRQY
ncbi:MAG: FtsW/RodA/SpoVE family cell cycle protein [Dehalococcoidia bacterium]|nr:FtsW/RodA/SpoVE family cell cycle protein [Dehalococcoidia bacterium]